MAFTAFLLLCWYLFYKPQCYKLLNLFGFVFVFFKKTTLPTQNIYLSTAKIGIDGEKFFALSFNPSAGKQDLMVSLFSLISVLISAGIELIFILLAGTVPCFGFSVRIVLITH